MNNRVVQVHAGGRESGSDAASGRKRAALVAGWMVVFAAAILAVIAAPAAAQKVETGALEPNVEHVLGFPGIHRGFKGVLSVQGDSLVMAWEKTKSSIKIADIVDLYTGKDSQQVLRGVPGGVIRIGTPFGGGHVLSLFSQDTEVLTVEFRDKDGGFHGAVFVFPKGKASDLKTQLVAAGAHASIPPEAAAPKH
jgi:hypothetical protein